MRDSGEGQTCTLMSVAAAYNPLIEYPCGYRTAYRSTPHLKEHSVNKTRNKEDIARFCLDLPGAREDYKWGGVRVFSVAEKKMFAVMDLVGQDLSFKVNPELFLGYVDRPGIRPAPYLARAHWISVADLHTLSDDEVRDLLTRSHQLVVGRLPKRQQIGLKL
ncbi:hypothetical protein ALP98_05363 [Pseudomonas viridiflava]|uniref:MmcQ/YjbR family DNA-binding protein n=3 Tax=Pseudomonas syringae group TaxID=136849 RepID=A0A3M4PKS8_PSEVI|nr:hypothetical protein ALQ30_03144 [Pseudomonas syringae pv. persicae]RMP81624.1 hypothetical protein ALQ15_05348 [Pseudomonas syringae pv. actinidiae]RMQ78815.1 hypothetical protein ALP98_05363 [Pseudomonas viridiflava]